MEPCMPERLVGVDVSESGDRTLVEDRRLDRRNALRQPPGEERLGERAFERLRTQPDVEVPLRVLALEQLPGAEPSLVAIGDPRTVLELEHGTLVRRRFVAEAARHPQMHEQDAPTLEPD